jgi:hypothetical protein
MVGFVLASDFIDDFIERFEQKCGKTRRRCEGSREKIND